MKARGVLTAIFALGMGIEPRKSPCSSQIRRGRHHAPILGYGGLSEPGVAIEPRTRTPCPQSLCSSRPCAGAQ